jgi:hypothetical protein
VEAYSTGLFRASFSGAIDLQAKVATALRALPSPGRMAAWSPLPRPVVVEWRETWSPSPVVGASQATLIDVHALPMDDCNLSARQLTEVSENLTQRLRTLGLVPASIGIETGSDSNAAWAWPAQPVHRGSWDDVSPESLSGIRVSTSGQRSACQQLPSDRLGSLLDPEDLPARVGSLLRLLGSIAPPGEGRWTIAVSLSPATILAVGPLADLGHRTSAQTTAWGNGPLNLEPDEAVSAGALDDGASEVGRVLARNLLDAFARRR